MKKLLILLLSLSLLTGCAATGGNVIPTVTESVPAEASASPESTSTETTATLAVAGDAMSHMPVTNDAYDEASGQYEYEHMLQYAAPIIEQADYAIANLETVLNDAPYSGYPTFNSPDALAAGLKQTGFDLLSTANNHTKDQGYDGMLRTLDVLDAVGLAHVGTYRTQQERDLNRGATVAEVGDITVAFLSYTYGLNGFTVSDEKSYCVSLLNTDYATTCATPDRELIQTDLAAAESLGTDLVAVIVHWGIEYWNQPSDYQKEMAAFFVENGADLVLGGHPHVLEPYEVVETKDASGQTRQGFVCYSLGNFLSSQTKPYTDTTAVLNLELHKDLTTGETTVSGVSYVPFYMLNRGADCSGDRFYLLDIHKSMEEYEAGESDLVTDTVYTNLKAALEHCHEILGTEGDAG